MYHFIFSICEEKVALYKYYGCHPPTDPANKSRLS